MLMFLNFLVVWTEHFTLLKWTKLEIKEKELIQLELGTGLAIVMHSVHNTLNGLMESQTSMDGLIRIQQEI